MTAVVLSTLFFTLLLPLSSASGGSAAIDVSTFSLEDFDTVESPTYQLQFQVTEFSSLSADIEVHVRLLSLEGAELQSAVLNRTVPADSSLLISHTFSMLPYGYSIVSVHLAGDVGSSNQSFTTSLNRTIQHLNPLEISLSESEDVLLSGIDSQGQLTGNSTIHDGDHVQIEVAVINSGDYPWTGSLNSNLTSHSSSEVISVGPISVGPKSSVMVIINSTVMVFEGTASLHLELNNSGDGNTNDEIRSFGFVVSPPPLPLIQMDAVLQTQSYSAGDILQWNASITNSGLVGFSGFFACTFESVSIFNQSLNLSYQAAITLPFEMTARPGTLQCIVSGERIDAASIAFVSRSLILESAAFESAGSAVPAVLNGPWHVGDSATFSMLVRNHGQETGHVLLVCETQGVVLSSSSLELGVDAAGEVALTVPMSVIGSQTVNWSLQSPDGSIDAGLNGSLLVPVAEQQTLTPLVTSAKWDSEVGVSFEWSLELSEGIDRHVRIRLGYTDASFETYPLDYEALLTPGVTSGEYVVGFVDATRVSIRATPENWTTGFGFSSHSLGVPDERPNYEIQLQQITSPLRPIEGESSTVTVQLRNTGDVLGMEGYIVLSTQDGALLGEKETTSLAANSDQSYSFTFLWPDGATVFLKATLIVEQQSLTDLESYQSQVVIVEEDSTSLPWTGIFGGIGLAVVIGAVLRLVQNRSRVPLTKSKSHMKKDDSSSLSSTQSPVEKIQVGCPECARQLRVPADYGGTVRCPDCSNRFDVTPRTIKQEEIEPENVEETVGEGDGKVELSCPKCSQSLRVPESYDGSVRCPACEEVFSSTGSSQ